MYVFSFSSLAATLECRQKFNSPGVYYTSESSLINAGTYTIQLPSGLGAVSKGWRLQEGGGCVQKGDELICESAGKSVQLSFTLTGYYPLSLSLITVKGVSTKMHFLYSDPPIKWQAEIPDFIDFGNMKMSEVYIRTIGASPLVNLGSSGNPIEMTLLHKSESGITLAPSGEARNSSGKWILNPEGGNMLTAMAAKNTPPGEWTATFTVTHTCD